MQIDLMMTGLESSREMQLACLERRLGLDREARLLQLVSREGLAVVVCHTNLTNSKR